MQEGTKKVIEKKEIQNNNISKDVEMSKRAKDVEMSKRAKDVEMSKSADYLKEIFIESEKLIQEFTITVLQKEVEKKILQKAVSYQPNIKLQGFRKGKAPLEMIKNQFKNEFEGEVINEVTQAEVFQKINSEKLKPVGQPIVDKVDYDDGKDLKIEFRVEVFPEVDITDLESMSVNIPKKDLEYTKFNEDENIKHLLQSQGKYEINNEKMIEEKNMVLFSIQSRNLSNNKKNPKKKERLVLSEESHSDILGIKDELINKKSGDKIIFTRKYPADYSKKPWAGKEIEHSLEVEKVFELKDKELDEDFFSHMGVKNKEELIAKMKEEYQGAKDQFIKGKKIELILDHLCDCKTFPVPRTLMEQNLKNSELQITQLSQSKGNNIEEKIIEIYKNIFYSIKKAFIINSIKLVKNLKVEEKEVDEKIKELADKQGMPFAQFKKLLNSNQQYKDQIKNDLENQKIQDYLLKTIKTCEV